MTMSNEMSEWLQEIGKYDRDITRGLLHFYGFVSMNIHMHQAFDLMMEILVLRTLLLLKLNERDILWATGEGSEEIDATIESLKFALQARYVKDNDLLN